MTSSKQLDANRNNALKSTGPKTEGGKDKVATNALKHGILSRRVVLENEDKEEFERVKQAFLADLKPIGVIESVLAERAIISYWRMQRVLTAEAGAVKRSANSWYTNIQERLKKANQYMQFGSMYDYKAEKMSNSVYAKRVITELSRMKQVVQEMGYLPDEERDSYAEIVNVREDKNEAGLFYMFCEIAKGNIEGEEKEKGKKALIYVFEKGLKDAEALLKGAQLVEDETDEANRMLSLVPDGELVDKLNRYETSLEKSMYQAIIMLKKLREIK